MSDYPVTDTLHIWWLVDPATPRYVGIARLLRATQGVSLEYSAQWLRTGIALSEDLPLVPMEHLPRTRDTAAGALEDARPDRWGERVIRIIDQPPRLSLLEYLYFAGDNRAGALGVSTSEAEYLPRRSGPLPRLGDVAEIAELARRILANEPLPEGRKRLLAPGVTMGGARPKGLIEMDGHPWIVKFAEEESWDAPLVEHLTLTLAATCGIRVALSRPIALPRGHAIAVKRFDREAGQRVHAQSALVALGSEGSPMGYPELAQLLRRRGPMEGGIAKKQMRELFRRMVFNILIDNSDDHERNHVLLQDANGHMTLSPAFDVLPTGQSLGYQQMRIGASGNDSTLDNALSEAKLFGLKAGEAEAEITQVVTACRGWQAHFRKGGISKGDLERLAQHVDRPFLARQASAFARPARRRAT